MNHWTENDFQKWLYGLKEEDAHLEACGECRTELDRLHVARQRILAAPQVSEEFLAAQRRQIHGRLNQTSRNFTLPRFRKSPVILTNDEQLYSDLAAMEQTPEPKAIQPLHKLFEE